MSAFVLDKKDIDLLTKATNAALELSNKYSASYHLSDQAGDIFSKYAGDLHSLYRILYITNIKAVNGRYGEDQKTLPKYTSLHPWDTDRINIGELKKACGVFSCYLYQCSEDPICGSPVFNALHDVHNLLCKIYVGKVTDWDGNDDY